MSVTRDRVLHVAFFAIMLPCAGVCGWMLAAVVFNQF